jgi:hypothetical protein
MYSLSISARHACGVYSRWVMALRNAWLAFLNIITKIELTLATLPRNTNLNSPNMITDQICKRTIVAAFHPEVFSVSLFIFFERRAGYNVSSMSMNKITYLHDGP